MTRGILPLVSFFIAYFGVVASTTPIGTANQYKGEEWFAHEDFTRIDGGLYFVSATGSTRNFTRYLEESHDPLPGQGAVEFYLGLDPSMVNTALHDLLAEGLLSAGEPVERHVRDVVPQVTFENMDSGLANIQAKDTMYINRYGNTQNFVNLDLLPTIHPPYSDNNFEGLVGGWMPHIRKLFRQSPEADEWWELIAFPDVDSIEPYLIKIWFRTTKVLNGTIQQQKFSREFSDFASTRLGPSAEEFYTALLRSADYWDENLKDVTPLVLPDQSWADMTKHSFAVELQVRYEGSWPKYGIRGDYAGSEYDGFQDIFTSSVMANLLWGRYDQAKNVIENYFVWFIDELGNVKMRGMEIPQVGLSLALLTTYARYTGDVSLLAKWKSKILAWVKLLEELHDLSLALPKSDPNYGLIAGWSESDSVLNYYPEFYVAPYWNNNVNSARGLKDLSTISIFSDYSASWTARAETMINQTASTLSSVIQYDTDPPRVPVLPVTEGTPRECMKQDKCQQGWAHRVYAEMLQPGLLPAHLANLTINSMQANAITSLGIVANVGPLHENSRDIIGFISYGYAQALLMLNRVDEFVLFLYSHRYHVYNRGQWMAGEVAGTFPGRGNMGAFCLPSEMTIPIIMRLALVLEHPDDDVLYLGRGVPKAWIETEKEISIKQAPTRWGPVDFFLQLDKQKGTVTSTVTFADRVPAKIHVKIKSSDRKLQVVANDVEQKLEGDEVILETSTLGRKITILGEFK